MKLTKSEIKLQTKCDELMKKETIDDASFKLICEHYRKEYKKLLEN